MPRAWRPGGPPPLLLLFLLLASSHGQGPDIEAQLPPGGDGGGDVTKQLQADPPQPPAAAEGAVDDGVATAEPQDLTPGASPEEASDLQTLISTASAEAQPSEQPQAEPPVEQSLEPAPEPLAPAEGAPAEDLAEAEPPADVAAASPELTEGPLPEPLPEPLPASPAIEAEAPRFAPAVGTNPLGRSIADGLGRALGAQMAAGNSQSTRGLVRKFMQNFARNMKYAVLADSKGDMPEEERLNQMQELERHQTPEERQRLLRAIGEASSQDDPEAAEGSPPLLLAAESRGFRHRPAHELFEPMQDSHRRGHLAHQRLRMLNGGGGRGHAKGHLHLLNGDDPPRQRLEALEVGRGCEAEGCAGAATVAADSVAQRAPPLLPLGGGQLPDEGEGGLQKWRSFVWRRLRSPISLVERSSARPAFGRPLLAAVLLALLCVRP
mmetsp:Transcript_2902/g.9365  ORF Transcript_2902/g.9365 Transcript_2902/m.9365 type:complete len:437 (+) Transcript_2902:60-1370(+)